MGFATPHHRSLAAAALFAAIALQGCALAGASSSALPAATQAGADDDLLRRCPQLSSLQLKLDRASAHFYFGEFDLAAAAARELLDDVGDLREGADDEALCERLDYLENRALGLLQRIEDDELATSTVSHAVTLIDSLARTTVVEEEIEVVLNEKTNHWIKYFTGSGRKHFVKWLARTGEYRGVIEPILVEVGVPRDLLFLAVIESGLSLTARSYAKAVGPWQFMSGTGRLFGLRINWWIDERRDLVAATYAAANYLKYLHGVFGSWPLALAAYNSGEHRVAYAMSRRGTADYWKLDLPQQTEWFVPKFMAALAIGRDPAAHGFEPPADRTIEFEIVEVDRALELRAVADAAGCSLEDLKQLNPQFKKWATPPDMVVEVKVPKGCGARALEQLAHLKTKGLPTFTQHKVKRGETLSSIAEQHDVTVKDLRRMNDMGSSSKIRAGNVLLVPVKDLQRSPRVASLPSYRAPQQRPAPVSMPLLSASDEDADVRYVVKRNDTLVKIAERFHARLADLRTWNDIGRDARLEPGDTLVVRRSGGAAAAAAVSGGAAKAVDAPPAADPADASADRWLVHVVRRGDTLSAISRRYRASLSDILAWNNRSKGAKLYPGERIRIRVAAD